MVVYSTKIGANVMPRCKHCNSKNVWKRGYRDGKIRIQCQECKKYDLVKEYEGGKIAARILLFDIETSPMEVYVWGLKYNNYISPDSIIKDFSVLCWSAKWLFDDRVIGEVVTGQQAINREDASILKTMWELLDEADIVITQNGKKFDIPKLNTRFLLAGYPPPMYYQSIDTKEVMQKTFGFSSNKLDYVNQFLGIDGKSDMEFEDWVECVRGNEERLEKMITYNKRDVVIMEELYLKLRPWIPAHANLGVYADVGMSCCPNCQSTDLRWTGQYATPLGLYEAFRCGKCGAIGRSTRKDYKISGVEVRN
jgi:ssDNA-binding Zn-finger/Zn-ribbon topoisomerase 1